MLKIDVGAFHSNISRPTRWFSSRFMAWPKKTKLQQKKCIFYIFGKCSQGYPGVPSVRSQCLGSSQWLVNPMFVQGPVGPNGGQ